MKNTAFNSIIAQNPSLRNFEQKKSLTLKTANTIFAEIMHFRRAPQIKETCKNSDCKSCSSRHLSKIISAIETNKPVTFVLPAFPGKSPNLEKVLGPLPDQAERLSLNFLGTLCQRIKKYYLPGIKIILCSDGRVFSDVIGMEENNVTAYHVELNKLINEMSLSDLSTFNLDDYYQKRHFKSMRDELMNNYGKSLTITRQTIRNGAKVSASSDEQQANSMYCGITRFLFEDSMYTAQTKSRSAIQKESRSKAYEVIRRSNAWSELIAERFPDSVRLSIHPQRCGSKKLGIQLIRNECWMTPWHGVAVETEEGHVLLKRAEAEALGAKLIYSPDGRPSHYRLMEKNLTRERLYEL